MRAAAPFAYDLTHLIARLRAETATGIDRVDLACAGYFLKDRPEPSLGLHFGRRAPHVMTAGLAGKYVQAAENVWTSARAASALPALIRWLERRQGVPLEKPSFTPPSRVDRAAWERRLLSWKGHIAQSRGVTIPQGAIYLNVGYHRMEEARYFSWLDERPDIRAIYMIHDLLPLDYPEFFAPGESDKFRVRLGTAFHYGRGFVVSTESVKARLEREMARCGLSLRPVIALPFPSPLADFSREPAVETSRPYFVTIGTIEPRKNHLLLLHLWRRLAHQFAEPPSLVMIGTRGWENEQVLDLLERSEAARAHVIEVNTLGSRDLVALIRGARALLAPSFDEGYGLPLVEALALGTPVIAADTAVACETSQGCAELLSPFNGDAWEAAIMRLVKDPVHFAERQRIARGFSPPTWPIYFARLDDFLTEL